MNWTIRLAAMVGVLSLAAIAAGQDGQVPASRPQAPGFSRMALGAFEVVAVSDGTVPQAMDELLTDIEPAEVRALAARSRAPLPLETSINAFLLDLGDRVVLVDTGAGTLFGPHAANQLVANLRAAGYGPERVDAVLLTHIHGDHSSGLTVDGVPIFPNATVHVHAAELAYWLDPAAAAAAPDQRKPYFEQARQALGPYQAAGRVRPFDAAVELFPGVTARPAPGHTPGHTYYEVTSRGQRLLLIGDAVHAGEIQFPQPSATIRYDVDPPAAARQRRRLFEEAAARGDLLGAAHVSFPGLGHLRTDGPGFAWIPLPYRSRPTP